MYDIYFSLPYLVVSLISVCSPRQVSHVISLLLPPFLLGSSSDSASSVFHLTLLFFVVSAALTLYPTCHTRSADLPCLPEKSLSFTAALSVFQILRFFHAAAVSCPICSIYSVYPSLFSPRPPYCYNDAVI